MAKHRAAQAACTLLVVQSVLLGGCHRNPPLPAGLAMEWEWPSYIYSPGTNEVYAPSAVRPAQYGVESYGATGNIVYGKLAGDIADPNYYFIIQPKVGDTGFVETEYGLKAEWSEALSELGVANPDP